MNIAEMSDTFEDRLNRDLAMFIAALQLKRSLPPGVDIPGWQSLGKRKKASTTNNAMVMAKDAMA